MRPKILFFSGTRRRGVEDMRQDLNCAVVGVGYPDDAVFPVRLL